jgi:hypothetical protein
MKLIEKTENLVYELSQDETERAIRAFIGLTGEYRLEALDIREGNPASYAQVILARDIETP